MLFLYLTSVIETILTDDEKLEGKIFAVAEGNTDALGEIYDMTSKSVFAYALSILKNRHDAEDVLHEVFISIMNGAVGYKAENKPLAWIMTITRNLCYMKHRAQKRSSFVPIEDAMNALERAEDATLEDRIILQECMQTLSDEEREIVVLHAVSGFRHSEIAEMTGLPLATVLSKYARSIKKLKKFLTQGDRKNEEP